MYLGVLLLVAGCSAKPRSNLLNLVSLAAHPLAQCNDGTAAAYYRRPLNSFEDTKKLLIYLQGGGMCAPYTPGNARNFSDPELTLCVHQAWTAGSGARTGTPCAPRPPPPTSTWTPTTRTPSSAPTPSSTPPSTTTTSVSECSVMCP